jgi:hypothetical protein
MKYEDSVDDCTIQQVYVRMSYYEFLTLEGCIDYMVNHLDDRTLCQHTDCFFDDVDSRSEEEILVRDELIEVRDTIRHIVMKYLANFTGFELPLKSKEWEYALDDEYDEY